MKINPVIMAGRFGSRLWPLSTEINPKQFIKKTKSEFSLLQNTLMRNKAFGVPIVITAEKYVSISKEQMEEIDFQVKIMAERFTKSTAMCAIIIALFSKIQGLI